VHGALVVGWGAYTDSGNLVKMNPPLRCCKSMAAMMQHVLDGNINIIGTDHAPHTLARKNDPTSPASGIPALPYWPRFIEILQDLGCSRGLIDSMTYYTAARLFKFDTHRARDGRCNVNIDYDPSLWDAYGWNPFEWVDKTYLSRREKAKTSNRPFHNAEAEKRLGEMLSDQEKAQAAFNALGSTDRGENGLYGTGY